MKGLIQYILIITITTVISAAHAFDPLPSGIAVNISLENTQYSSAESLLVYTTFTNTTLEDITFLKWNTPLEEGFKNNLFNIQDSQLNSIKYTGKLLKRPHPKASDYIILQAGESITTTSNLSLAYDIKNMGEYTVSYRNSTNTKTLRFYLLHDKVRSALLKETSSSECTTEQKSILKSVIPEASKIATISATLLKEISDKNYPVSERYTQWFGTYDIAHYQTVLSGFNAINKSIESNTIIFKCDCEENAIAYVYPDIPYEIHICSAFWELSLKGTDSQSGTVIHELSHFKTTLNANDHVYGKKKSLALAADFPEKAIMNADNYEYFSENNNPYLAMYTATLADSHEPDNSKATAKLITQDQPQIYSIHTKTDTDWLKFEVLTDSYVNIHTIGPYKGDTDLRLLNEAGELISFGGDIDATINNNYSEIGIDGLKSGTYYIKVTGYKGNATVTEYKITLTILPVGSGKTFENDSNNNTSSNSSSSGSIFWPTLILFLFIGILRRSTKAQKIIGLSLN